MSVTPPVEPAPGGTVVLTTWFSSRIGGVLVPLAATVLAFLIGGLVVAITGHNPLTAYKAIFEGTGLNWFFPWVSGEAREEAANDLQQTLILMTPLILTGPPAVTADGLHYFVRTRRPLLPIRGGNSESWWFVFAEVGRDDRGPAT